MRAELLMGLVLFGFGLALSGCAGELPNSHVDTDTENLLWRVEQAKREAANSLSAAKTERIESERLLAEARGLQQRKIIACEQAKKKAIKKRVICPCNQAQAVSNTNADKSGQATSVVGNEAMDPPYSPSDAPQGTNLPKK